MGLHWELGTCQRRGEPLPCPHCPVEVFLEVLVALVPKGSNLHFLSTVRWGSRQAREVCENPHTHQAIWGGCTGPKATELALPLTPSLRPPPTRQPSWEALRACHLLPKLGGGQTMASSPTATLNSVGLLKALPGAG